MKRIHTKTPNRGFTLIELLIVIGLLGALTALVLPSLTADREEALGSICDYNQAGTVRTLRQFASMMGHYPNQFHTGLYTETATTKGAVGSTGVMPGLPGAQKSNIGPDATEASITLDMQPDRFARGRRYQQALLRRRLQCDRSDERHVEGHLGAEHLG